jgi:hypothetical protein
MKLIFLDIDGVFNHYGFIERSRVHHNMAFCPIAVQNVREVIKRTGAKIVVSSTWRRGSSVAELRELFNYYDLGAYVIGKTPVIEDVIRGIEIQKYLDDHKPVESFVIIDDDADMGELMPSLVHCKSYSGFIKNWHREMAIALLNKQPYIRLSETRVGDMFDHDGKVVNRDQLDKKIQNHHLKEPVKLISADHTATPLDGVHSDSNDRPVVLIDVGTPVPIINEEVEQLEPGFALPPTLQIQGFHGFSFDSHVIPQIVVYYNPLDFPGMFVARLVIIKKGEVLFTPYVMIENEIKEVHDHIPEQFGRLDRDPNDDPAIYEIWM